MRFIKPRELFAITRPHASLGRIPNFGESLLERI
jgi:hypothetical protein